MDLKEYLKLFKKNRKMIIAVSLLIGISAFLFSISAPAKFDVSLSLFITKSGTQETDDFKYDGYHALEAEDTLSDSISEWLKSPEVVNDIYSKSGVDPSFKNIKSYTKEFKAKKLSADFVEVVFSSKNADEASKISSAITETVNSKLGSLKTASDGEVSFSISSSKPIIVENKPDVFFNFVIGIISGMLLGIFITLFKRYFAE